MGAAARRMRRKAGGRCAWRRRAGKQGALRVGCADAEEGPSGMPGSRGEGLWRGTARPASTVEGCGAAGRTRVTGRLARPPPPLLHWRARRQASQAAAAPLEGVQAVRVEVLSRTDGCAAKEREEAASRRGGQRPRTVERSAASEGGRRTPGGSGPAADPGARRMGPTGTGAGVEEGGRRGGAEAQRGWGLGRRCASPRRIWAGGCPAWPRTAARARSSTGGAGPGRGGASARRRRAGSRPLAARPQPPAGGERRALRAGRRAAARRKAAEAERERSPAEEAAGVGGQLPPREGGASRGRRRLRWWRLLLGGREPPAAAGWERGGKN
jgi:hypothetical protein